MALAEDLVCLVLQFLNEEKYTETARMLEQESGLFLNLKYLEELVIAGKFDEAERYLLGFTQLHTSRHSVKIFFEIRKQKYLEALDTKDRSKSVQILRDDLKVFENVNPGLYKELTELLTMDNFRENAQLKAYKDAPYQRICVFQNIKSILEANPMIKPKLILPGVKALRLKTLVNQSLSWQHTNCRNPQPNPDIRTLYVDHICEPSTGALTPSPVNDPLKGSIKKAGAFPPIVVHSRLQAQVCPATNSLSGLMANRSPPVQHAAVASGAAALVQPPNAGVKRPRTPPARNGGILYQFTDSEDKMERPRAGQADEVRHPGPIHPHNMYSEKDLPKIVVRSLNQGSNVVSMDFHPQQQTILLVGTDVGDIGIWEVFSSEKLTHKSLNDWDASNRTIALQAALSKESAVSVNRCLWSSDGAFVGVAFSEHIVHIYSYNATGVLKQHHEIDAHIGGVNDIAFVHLQEMLLAITCGDDKIVKVWDAQTGYIQYTFEGHEAPVYSVCPHQKENVQFIFSIDVDGRIKAWLYDPPVCKVDFDAPKHGCAKMAYTVDGSRLFTCGTSKEGESYLVEWDEKSGLIKRRYSGIGKQSSEMVKFATTKDRFLAAGDECQIKFWDMNDINILSRIDAEGCLQARSCLCFNKKGSLLAVTTSDHGIKILASADGVKLLHMLENRRLTAESKGSLPNVIGVANTSPVPGAPENSERIPPAVLMAPLPNLLGTTNTTGPVPEASKNSERIPPAVLTNGVVSNSIVDVEQRLPNEGTGKSKNWKFAEVTDPGQCRSIRLTDPLPAGKIVRLLYTHSGSCLLALDSNATHKLWMWQRNDWNLPGKVTTNVPPQFCQPPSGTVMINSTSDRGLEEVVPCIALSKNDSYIVSASGGKVSLFNIRTFQVLDSYMPPPPAATCLAFHPLDNNTIAIGMEDSTVQIFNIRLREVNMILRGHQNRITGLTFSTALNLLVSSGADAQLCLWNTNGWEKCKSKSILSQEGTSPSPLGDTTVQFDSINQVQMLVVQENQIAIYAARELECLCHWAPRDPFPAPISSATYSCDSLLVYASFFDGSIGVFDADVLRPRCRIAPTAFIPNMGRGNIYPFVIAVNPHEPNQIAVGLSDGGIHVIESLPHKEKWGF